MLVSGELMTLFPDAKFIQIIRDPRAVIASMLRVGKRGKKEGWRTQPFTHSTFAAIKYIRRCYDSAKKTSELFPDRMTSVHYEDLVTNPEKEMKRLCNFIDAEWTPKMLSPEKVSHLGEQAITNKVWYTKAEYNRGVVTSELDKWKSQLNCIQKAIILSSFHNTAEFSRAQNGFSKESISKLEIQFNLLVGKIAVVTLKSLNSIRKFPDKILKLTF